MKSKIAILVATLLATGCSMFTSRTYDPVEYNYAISIAVDATHAVNRCQTRKDGYNEYLQKINSATFTLDEYVSNKNDSEQVLPAALQIREIAKDLLQNKTYSTRYCQHKLSNIQAAARMFARGVGSTDRFNVCSGNIQNRFEAFEQSLARKEITKLEFVDLSGDLIRLETIDQSGCSLSQRADFEMAITGIKAALSLML